MSLCAPVPAPSPAPAAAGGHPLRRYHTLGRHDGGVIVVVQHEPNEPGVLQCDGTRLVTRRPLPCSTPVPDEEGFDIRAGQRLADDQSGLELICTKGGTGTLTFNERPLRHLLHASQPIHLV